MKTLVVWMSGSKSGLLSFTRLKKLRRLSCSSDFPNYALLDPQREQTNTSRADFETEQLGHSIDSGHRSLSLGSCQAPFQDG
jgi:hypothetical protein